MPLAELFYNNAVQASTSKSPFSLVYGKELHLPIDSLVPPCVVPHAESFITRIRESWLEAKENLEAAQLAQKTAADRKRRPEPIATGDLVLLNARNIRLKGVSAKFKPRFIGPYRVQRVRGTAITLQLPPELASVHPTFHQSLVKPYHGEYSEPAPVEVEGG